MSRLIASALVFVWPLAVVAVPPTLTRVVPASWPRGVAVEVTLQGANLPAKPRLLLPFAATQEPLADAKPTPARVRVRLTVPANTPTGPYLVRVVGDNGISPAQLVTLDDLPADAEKEPNDTPAQATTVRFPGLVVGQCGGGDIDYVRFTAKAGQRLWLETVAARAGSDLLPLLRLTDATGRLLATDDSQRLSGDARIGLTVPADGDYLLELCDTRFRGGNPADYRLHLRTGEPLRSVFPLGGRLGTTDELTATSDRDRPFRVAFRGDDTMRLTLPDALWPWPLAVGVWPERLAETETKDPRRLDVLPPTTINGRFDRPRQRHRWQVAVQPGAKYRFTVEAAEFGSALDGVLTIRAGDQVLAEADDAPLPSFAPGQPGRSSADPRVEGQVPAKVTLLAVELRDQRWRGGANFGYRLTIEPARPEVDLVLPVGEINVPRTGSVLLKIAVTRRGEARPLRIVGDNLPVGLALSGGDVAANSPAGLLVLTAGPTVVPPAVGVWRLRLQGELPGGERVPVRAVRPFNRDGQAFDSGLGEPAVPVALTDPSAVAVTTPATIAVMHGEPIVVPVKLTRRPLPPAAVALSAEVPPEVTPPTITFDAKTDTAMLTLPAKPLHPLGTWSLVPTVGGLAVGPAVTITNAPPYTVTPPGLPVSLPRGQMTAVKLPIVRHAAFKGTINVQVAGLPAGVTLVKPLPMIPPTASEIVWTFQVAATATAGPATLTLKTSTVVNGQPLPAEPVSIGLAVGP